MKYLKKFNEGLKDTIDEILDKISDMGIDSLSNHEKTLLKSYGDKSIDYKDEINKHINKYKAAKEIIKTIPLNVDNNELSKNIGRYIKYKPDKDWQKKGLLVNMGIIYEIIAIQKHWGYVDGKYVSDKIGYRVVPVSEEGDFGRAGDVDEIEFMDITEEDAIKINQKVYSDFEKGIYPKWMGLRQKK